MEISVKKTWKNPTPGKWPLGRVDVDIVMEGAVITIHSITIARSNKEGQSMFISLPQQQGLKKDPSTGHLIPQLDDKTGKPIYYKIIEFSKEAHFQLQDAILEAFGDEQVGEPRSNANQSTRTIGALKPLAAAVPAAKAEPAEQVGLDEDVPF